MKTAVCTAGHEHQVLGPVVLPVAVDMVNDLIRMQPTPKQALHDQPRALGVTAPTSCIAFARTYPEQHVPIGAHYIVPTAFKHGCPVARPAQVRAVLFGLAAAWAVGARNMVLPSAPDGIPCVTADADRARRQLRRSTGADIMRVLATAAADFLRERTSRAAALGAGAKLHTLSLLQTRQDVYLGG